jgi:glycosyltransferase involved in cell wall biosynthesis
LAIPIVMRILHLDCGQEMRGGQWQALYLIRGLRARGHEVRLLARAGSPLLETAAAEGLDALPFTAWGLASQARRFDVVHAHDARSHALAALVGVSPLVVSRRVAFAVRRSLASRWKYARARHYIAVSEFVAGRLMEAGVSSADISVVYDGAPVCERAGRLGAHLVAPSTKDPMKGSDLAATAALRAGVQIKFSTEIARDLDGARALVYITRSEGLGSAALVAMAAGVPVIASRVGGLPEAVVHGETGLLVENTVDDIAEAMRRIVADPAYAAAMGAAARKRAAERFSIDRMVEGAIHCYEKAARL